MYRPGTARSADADRLAAVEEMLEGIIPSAVLILLCWAHDDGPGDADRAGAMGAIGPSCWPCCITRNQRQRP